MSRMHQLTQTLTATAAICLLNSSCIKNLCACRLTEDCEQRVRAMESLDVCSSKFSFSRSEEAVRSQRSRMLCDVLLDQAVMPGVGNIIKNEALFDSGLHPAVKVWKRWWIVFSRGTKKGVKMQDNSHRKSLSPCIIEWCIAMSRVKQGKRQTSALRHRYASPSMQFGNVNVFHLFF